MRELLRDRGPDEPNRFADPGDYILMRRAEILALNNTWLLEQQHGAGAALRLDAVPRRQHAAVDFDPRSWLLADLPRPDHRWTKFPQVRIRGYDSSPAQTMGAIDPTQINWKSSERQRHLLEVGRQAHLQGRRRLPQIGVDSYIPGDGAGFFDFDKDITSSNGAHRQHDRRQRVRRVPARLSRRRLPARQSTLSVSTPLNLFTYYFGGYVQDDWRVSPKLTLNYGLRVEHEDGLREENNSFTVASIRR